MPLPASEIQRLLWNKLAPTFPAPAKKLKKKKVKNNPRVWTGATSRFLKTNTFPRWRMTAGCWVALWLPRMLGRTGSRKPSNLGKVHFQIARAKSSDRRAGMALQWCQWQAKGPVVLLLPMAVPFRMLPAQCLTSEHLSSEEDFFKMCFTSELHHWCSECARVRVHVCECARTHTHAHTQPLAHPLISLNGPALG